MSGTRYEIDTHCFEGVNGYMIYDNNWKHRRVAIGFATVHAWQICAALNKEAAKLRATRQSTKRKKLSKVK